MMNKLSQQIQDVVILCGVACFMMIFVNVTMKESYDSTYQRIGAPKLSSLQILNSSGLVTTRNGGNECSIVHPKLNSCNTLPNYYLYADRRGEFQSAVINFWHIQKAGGSSVEKCLAGIQHKLGLPSLPRLSTYCLHLGEVYSKLTYFQNDSFIPVIQGHDTLGLCDFFHEINLERKCSTFVVFREPYERAVSHYYFARKEGLKGNLVGEYQRALKMPIKEWIKQHGSPVWMAFHRIWRTNMTKNGKLQCKMISDNSPAQKWPSNDTIVDQIIHNLDKHLSFVGLLEDMLTTYQMLEDIYNLPFVNECYGEHVNKGSYENLNAIAKLGLQKKSKRTLMEDEEIRKLMTFDVRLYEKAKEMFDAQRKLRASS